MGIKQGLTAPAVGKTVSQSGEEARNMRGHRGRFFFSFAFFTTDLFTLTCFMKTPPDWVTWPSTISSSFGFQGSQESKLDGELSEASQSDAAAARQQDFKLFHRIFFSQPTLGRKAQLEALRVFKVEETSRPWRSCCLLGSSCL